MIIDLPQFKSKCNSRERLNHSTAIDTILPIPWNTVSAIRSSKVHKPSVTSSPLHNPTTKAKAQRVSRCRRVIIRLISLRTILGGTTIGSETASSEVFARKKTALDKSTPRFRLPITALSSSSSSNRVYKEKKEKLAKLERLERERIRARVGCVLGEGTIEGGKRPCTHEGG